MRNYTDCASQQARQVVQQAAVDAAVQAQARARQVARMKAAWHSRKTAADRLKQLEENGNFASVATGTDYERFVMFCVNAAGYTCRHLGGSGDLGADLIIDLPPHPSSSIPHPFSPAIVVQCKFYSQPVGYDAVKEAYTAKALYKAERAWVVTNSTYTDQARTTARTLGIDLLHHADIHSALAKA